jgi:hypothetical protein
VGCGRYGQHELLDFVPTNPGLRSDTPTVACAHPRMRAPTHARTHACARTLCPPARAVGMGKIIIVCSYVPGIVDSGSSCLVLPDTMLQVSPCPL